MVSTFALKGKDTILCPIESVDSSVPLFMNILTYIQDNFDPDGKFDRAKGAIESNCRWDRNYLEFFKVFMNIEMELSTLSMGQRTLDWNNMG